MSFFSWDPSFSFWKLADPVKEEECFVPLEKASKIHHLQKLTELL